jgi:hypothetical protein
MPTVTRRLPVAVAGLVVLASGLVGAYVIKGPRWPTRTVPYYVNAANLDLGASEAEAAIRQGADGWSAQSDADVALVYAGTTSGTTVLNNAKNEVFFRNESNGSAIATTYSWYSGSNLIDTDIVFWDGAYRFFSGTSGCSGGLYIEDIATHEFGHALGLGHSDDTSATMYYSTSYCSQGPRSLAPDDIAGIEAIYPGAAPAPPAPPTNLQVIGDAASTSSTPGLHTQGLVTSKLALPTLSAGTKYYWRVVATNVDGSTSGPVWSFTTKAARTRPGGKK